MNFVVICPSQLQRDYEADKVRKRGKDSIQLRHGSRVRVCRLIPRVMMGDRYGDGHGGGKGLWLHIPLGLYMGSVGKSTV